MRLPNYIQNNIAEIFVKKQILIEVKYELRIIKNYRRYIIALQYNYRTLIVMTLV